MDLTRREFLAAGAAVLATPALPGEPDDIRSLLSKPMPRRVLGRTGEKVSILGFGSAALGHSFQPQEVFDRMVGEALDHGVNYIDTATIYDVAQERLGPIVRKHRKRMFLVTKTRGMDRAGALRTIEESLRLLQTDHVDLVHLHNVADFPVEQIMDENSALRGLEEARKRGWTRFIGITGHYRVSRFIPVLNTGLIDAMMLTHNFVDRNTYDYEGEVFPVAWKHRTGIVAMKVLGGAPGMNYRRITAGMAPASTVEHATRWAMTHRDITTAVMGFHLPEYMHQAIRIAKSLKPLTDGERTTLLDEGKRLAQSWGPHLGPAA